MSNIVGHVRAIGKLVGLSAGIITVVAVVSAYVYLPLNAKVWHLTHGDIVQCDGVRVSVPHGWYPEPIDSGCQLIRATYTFPLRHGFWHPEKVFINVVDTQHVEDEKWRQDVIARLRREGKNFRSVSELTVGGIPTVCFDWNTTESPSGSVVSCNLDQHIVVNFFYYDEKLKSDLNEILRGLQVIPSGTPGQSLPQR